MCDSLVEHLSLTDSSKPETSGFWMIFQNVKHIADRPQLHRSNR